MPITEPLPEAFYERQAGSLPGLLGIELVGIAAGGITMSMEVQGHHMSPNGFLHAASVVALADSAAGYGCEAHLPRDAIGFTTIELKTNFLGTAKSGRIVAKASLMHGGRTTQVWDTIIRDAAGKTMALFRCTQAILWPRN